MKKIFMYVLFTFIIIVVLSLIMFDKNNSKDEFNIKLDKLDNIDRKISYFKYKNIDRYIDYKEKNPNLSNKDIITRVNIGLDYPFYTNTKVSNHLNKIDILVNKYIYLPSEYIPDNLEEIDNKLLVSDAKNSFIDLREDIKKENLNIRIISAYRSYSYQENLYNGYKDKDGEKEADTYSARPGFSEHQTGLVIDIDNTKLSYEEFEKTKEYNWMINNSYKYGFILRYPKGKEDITGYNYESWHYRYVGKKIAKYIHDHDITLDEYYIRFIDKEQSHY